MKQEVKKASGNANSTFRKLSIANTTLTWLGFAILAAIAVLFLIMGIKNIPEPAEQVELGKIAKTETIMVWAIMAVIALVAIASLAIGIVQSVFSKKIGTVGKLNYKGIIAILIVFLGLGFIAAVGTDYLAYTVYLATGQSAKLYFYIAGIACGSALFLAGAAIFNTLLCVWTKPTK